MYRSLWSRKALKQLAEIWVNATDRSAVTDASHSIDPGLKADPRYQGESRPNHERVMFASPLAVRFRVYPQQNLVRVLACWQIRQV